MENNAHHRIDYIEFPVQDVAAAKRFYSEVFGWEMEDWGPDYSSFKDGRLNGGFRREDSIQRGTGSLVILYSISLEATEKRVVDAGGKIVVPTFEFPGGRRFHFQDPEGNELAIWSDR